MQTYIQFRKSSLVRLLIVSALSILLTFLILPAFTTHAATLTVTNALDSGPGSLRQTISNAGNGDTIVFDPNVFSVPVTITLISGVLNIDKNLTIDGAGVFTPTISGNNASRVISISVSSNVTLNRLNISNGNSSPGGGIYNQGNLTATNVKIANNVSQHTGGGIFNSGTLMITNGAFYSNTATYNGAGIANYGVLTVTNSTFENNIAQYGGGIYNSDITGIITVTNSIFNLNKAYNGTLTSGGGGGIYNTGLAITVANSTFTANSSVWGGGIFNIGGTVTMTNSYLERNHSFGDRTGGGGVFNESPGKMVVTASTFSRNDAQSAGGGIGNRGILTVTNTAIVNNTGGYGTFGSGGGLQNSQAGISNFINVTFSGNRALGTSDDGGGGIMVYGGTVNLVHCTVANNQTTSTVGTDGGGGINIKSGSGGKVVLTNTLVVSNTSTVSKPDLSGNFTSGGYNLIGSIDGSSGITNGNNGDIAGTNAAPINAFIGALGNNGGATQTIPLLPNSPAIDQISIVNGSCNNTGITVDQRGYARPYPADGKCDIGAFEWNLADQFYQYLPLIMK